MCSSAVFDPSVVVFLCYTTFALEMMSLSYTLRKCSAITKSQKINQLLPTDCIMIFPKCGKKTRDLYTNNKDTYMSTHTRARARTHARTHTHIYRNGIWKKFHAYNEGKGSIRTLREKEKLQVPKNIKSGQNQINRDARRRRRRRRRRLLETKRSAAERINTWAVSVVEYSEPLLKWTRD